MQKVFQTGAAFEIFVLEFSNFIDGLHVYDDCVIWRVHQRDKIIDVLYILSNSARVDLRLSREICVGQKLRKRRQKIVPENSEPGLDHQTDLELLDGQVEVDQIRVGGLLTILGLIIRKLALHACCCGRKRQIRKVCVE